MADYKEDNVENNKRKRVRDDSEDDSDEVNSAELKLARVDSVNSDDSSAEPNLDLSNSDVSPGVEAPEAKLIEDDLLSSILDELEPDPEIQGLDSVMRSFEEEILLPCDVPPVMTSDSGEQRPELGYLLEASDDELGLPPRFSEGDEQNIVEAVDLKTIESETPVALDNIGLGFDDGILSYDSYKFGVPGDSENNFSHDFITLGGGLFDSYEPADISECTWRPESLSAS